MNGFADSHLTQNDFLGGRVRLLQPATGYRAGIDPVLLAASVPARVGERVLELGCGSGVALLCLAARVAGLRLTGVEVQPDYAALGARNAALNGTEIDIVTADLVALPAPLRADRFDHVIANPPYFRPGTRTPAREAGRETGLAESLPLDAWIRVAAKRCAPGGLVTVIQRADRISELFCAMQARLGSLRCLPIQPRCGRDAALILMQGKAGGRAAPRLHAPLILHEGASHAGDGESFRPEINAVLRDGRALSWPR